MSNNEQTQEPLRRSLIVILVALVLGIGWFVLQARDNADKTLDQAKKVQTTERKAREEAKQSPSTYAGWKTYAWASQKMSFKYPGDWFVSEDTGTSRLYVKNSQVDLLKEETPDNFQQIWLSYDTDEAAQARETAIKNGTSEFRVVSGTVKTSTVAAGSLTINVYEYDTTGGPTLEAYWTNKAGQRMSATTSTEVGQQNQTDMVANLKKILASITQQ
jgi:hypothetical protein